MKSTRAVVKTDTLIPNPRNNNVHPAEQIEMLKASIRRFGQPRPVLARQANRMLIVGHGIHQAMQELGLDEIAVVLWDVDQKTADEFMLADNRLAQYSHFDRERTKALLADVPEEDFEALGFTLEDLDSLLDEGGSDSPVVREIETSDVSDRFWISVQGPLEHQAAALKRLQELMADLPDVEVDLGTIALEA